MVPKFDKVIVGLRKSAGVRLRSRTRIFMASICRRQSAGPDTGDIAQHRHEQPVGAVDGETEIDLRIAGAAKAWRRESSH